MISNHCYEVSIHLVCEYFWHFNQNNTKGWSKIEAGRELENFCKTNTVVTMLNDINDMKDFCCLDLKCSVMFRFTTFC